MGALYQYDQLTPQMPRSVSTNRTLTCVKLFCCTGISMFITFTGIIVIIAQFVLPPGMSLRVGIRVRFTTSCYRFLFYSSKQVVVLFTKSRNIFTDRTTKASPHQIETGEINPSDERQAQSRRETLKYAQWTLSRLVLCSCKVLG
jgi:hypothetical protein